MVLLINLRNMEKRKESLRAAKVCRFCLSQDQSLDNLYDRNRAPKNAINLHLKILSCVAIEVCLFEYLSYLK